MSLKPPLEICQIIGDDEAWEETRTYAKDLTRSAGLMIKNDMPPHLPEHGQENAYSAFQTWIEECRATTLTDPLSRDELTLFNQRYLGAAFNHYSKQGYLYRGGAACVIAVFERSTGSTKARTKYAIDESLHGKERIQAIKKAAKAARKAKKTKSTRDEKDDKGPRSAEGMC